MTCGRAAHQVTLQKLHPNQMSMHNATSKGNSWSCSAAWCLGQVVHRRDHQPPFPGNPFMTWENQPHFSKVILFYIPDITQIIIKYPQYLPYIPHTVFPKYLWKMYITPKYPRKISTKNTRNKPKSLTQKSSPTTATKSTIKGINQYNISTKNRLLFFNTDVLKILSKIPKYLPEIMF